MKAIMFAREKGVYSEFSRQAQERLAMMQPGQFALNKEIMPEDSFWGNTVYGGQFNENPNEMIKLTTGEWFTAEVEEEPPEPGIEESIESEAQPEVDGEAEEPQQEEAKPEPEDAPADGGAQASLTTENDDQNR